MPASQLSVYFFLKVAATAALRRHLPAADVLHLLGNERAAFGVRGLLGLAAALLLGFSSEAQNLGNPVMERGRGDSWGAIAAQQGWYGYSFNHRTQREAEAAARAQCDRTAGRTGTCEVRTTFNRSCAAMAIGNFGEWGTASGLTTAAAGKAAMAQCESHLPTEPCKVVVNACSGR